MKISFIIPVFNTDTYLLQRCINSIRLLKECDKEILIIDDGSQNEETIKYENELAIDNRIVVIRQDNSGPAAARNRGLDNASGDFIVFVDSDDYLLSDNFDFILSKAKDNDFFDILFFSNSEKSVSKEMIKDSSIKSMQEQSTEKQMFLCFGIVWGKIYNKKYIGDVRFNEKLRYCEDVLFNMNLKREEGKFFGVGVQAIVHEENAESLCHKYNPKVDELLADAIIELEKVAKGNYSNLYRESFFGYYYKHILPLKVFNEKNKKSIWAKNREACDILYKEPYLHIFKNLDYNELSLKRKIIYRLSELKLIFLGYYLIK